MREKAVNVFQVVFAGVGGWLGWFLGGFDGFLYALLILVITDYLTGFMVAVIERKLSSQIGFRGIFKKVLIFTFVGIGHVIDSEIIGDGSAVRTAVIFFYMSNEGISIIENSAKIGLPVPEKIRKVILNLKGDEK